VGLSWFAMARSSSSRVSQVADDSELPEGSWATSIATRKSMQGNRNRDTSPEIAVRSLVHRAGLRYRVAARPLPGLRRTADLVFRPTKVSVFIDGCYWHMCPEHGHYPASNASYWTPKLQGNVRRDRETDEQLGEAGWLVMRFWEHQPSDAIADAVIAAVGGRREPGSLRQNPARS